MTRQAPAPQRLPADIVTAARRIEERADLRAPVSLHLETGERLAATLTDLTTRGCRVELDRGLPTGAHVTVAGRSTMIGGAVAWSAETSAGVEFGARLMPKALRALGA